MWCDARVVFVWISTRHDGADEQEDTQENVAGQDAVVVDDLALADDEDDAKNLTEEADSWRLCVTDHHKHTK